MNKFKLGTLFFLFSSIIIQNCDNIVKPGGFSKIDIIGTWHEADTSMGSEGWSFSDTAAVHKFTNLDTIGHYPVWKISNDSIVLTNEQNKNEILVFKKTNANSMNLKYYRWNTFIDKDFLKNKSHSVLEL